MVSLFTTAFNFQSKYLPHKIVFKNSINGQLEERLVHLGLLCLHCPRLMPQKSTSVVVFPAQLDSIALEKSVQMMHSGLFPGSLSSSQPSTLEELYGLSFYLKNEDIQLRAKSQLQRLTSRALIKYDDAAFEKIERFFNTLADPMYLETMNQEQIETYYSSAK